MGLQDKIQPKSNNYMILPMKRGYRRRAALERINARLDHSFEFEQLHPGVVPDAHARRCGAVGDDGAGVGSGAGRASGTDALAVRPGSLGRHRLTGIFRPKPSRSGPAGQEPARARRPHWRILPFHERLIGVLQPCAGSFAPRRTVSSTPGAAGWSAPPTRKPHSAHASVSDEDAERFDLRYGLYRTRSEGQRGPRGR